MSPALYLADTSGLFRLLQAKTGEAWDEQLAAGVIATCPVVELEFLCSARSLADRLEKQRLFQRLFTWVPMPDDAYERASEIQQRLTETGHRGCGHRAAGSPGHRHELITPFRPHALAATRSTRGHRGDMPGPAGLEPIQQPGSLPG